MNNTIQKSSWKIIEISYGMNSTIEYRWCKTRKLIKRIEYLENGKHIEKIIRNIDTLPISIQNKLFQ
jgi:hypothetical protein